MSRASSDSTDHLKTSCKLYCETGDPVISRPLQTVDVKEVSPGIPTVSPGMPQISPGLSSETSPGIPTVSPGIPEDVDSDEESGTPARNKELADLAHGCCDKLLNPAFLRGAGEPFFKETSSHQLVSVVSKTQMDLSEFTDQSAVDDDDEATGMSTTMTGISIVLLRSSKMKALEKLLTAPRLNNNAITLQLTAQSQVHLKHGRPGTRTAAYKSYKRTRYD